jgi:NADH dehydrogenase [ubiquinone] 1 alpha subcomplex assembly factor 1
MKSLIILLTLSLFAKNNMQEVFVFSKQTNIKEWRIVNDGVMGGISSSSLTVTADGHGLFSGHVSLDYNGGFASIQLNTAIEVKDEKKFVVLYVKGDRKAYEFRLKAEVEQAESYVHQFVTSGAWEKIKLPINEFYPQFRGRKLRTPNFNFNSIAQMSFLIANKQEEDFNLLVDWIGLE